MTTTLSAGQSMTFTLFDANWSTIFSDISLPLAGGTQVWAQVDAVDELTSYGGVLELDEVGVGPYNNILGPAAANLSAVKQSQPLIFRR